MERIKKAAVPVIASIIIVISVYLCMFLFISVSEGDFRGGIRTTEKTAFEDVCYYSFFDNSIRFKQVWVKRTVYGETRETVNVENNNFDRISVKVDPKSSRTLLSVTPMFFDRLLPWGYHYSAKKIVIWVFSEEEKIVWEAWLKKAIEKAAEKQRLEKQKYVPPPARKIIPKG